MRRDNKEFKERFARWKNGEKVYEAGKPLPKYEIGKEEDDFYQRMQQRQRVINESQPKLQYTRQNGNPIKFDEQGNLVDQVTGQTGTMYQEGPIITPKRYDAYGSTYDPKAITDFTGFIPGIGDVEQGFMAKDAFDRGNYLEAGLLGGMLLIPNIIEKPLKYGGKLGYKFLRQNSNIPRQLIHDIISDPKMVIKEKINGNYAFTQKGRDRMLSRDNANLLLQSKQVLKNLIDEEIEQGKKRLKLAEKHNIPVNVRVKQPTKILPNVIYSNDVLPIYAAQNEGNIIKIRYHKNPKNSFFRDNTDPKKLNHIIGHEYIHSFEDDEWFAPFLNTSRISTNTNYGIPNVPLKGMEGIEDIHPTFFSNGQTTNPLMGLDEVQYAFSPTIMQNNINQARVAEAKMLQMEPVFDSKTSTWYGSPAEVVADLRALFANKRPIEEIYDYMYKKHKYLPEQIDALRELGF